MLNADTDQLCHVEDTERQGLLVASTDEQEGESSQQPGEQQCPIQHGSVLEAERKVHVVVAPAAIVAGGVSPLEKKPHDCLASSQLAS